APAGVPRLPRLERAALASRRHAGRGDPRQDSRREVGAAREGQPRGDVLAEGQGGVRAGVFEVSSSLSPFTAGLSYMEFLTFPPPRTPTPVPSPQGGGRR